MTGRVRPEGIDLNYISIPVQEIFFRMLKYHEFDASEMSMASYMLSLERPTPEMIAIPVFPMRFFRHASIYVNTNSGIVTPKDLIGKRVGVPEWQLTAGVWIRGILQDHYGVPLTSVTYFSGGEESSGRKEKIPFKPPEGLVINQIAPDKTLSAMLDEGEIDALYTPRFPSCFVRGSKNVRRLFPNFKDEERRYYSETKIFPIMHTIVIRRDIYNSNRWVARSLYKAFLQAQSIAYENLFSAKEGVLKTMLPWVVSYVEETINLMGQNYWPYGVEPNEKVLDTFLNYSFQQGLSSKKKSSRELFAEETWEAFRI